MRQLSITVSRDLEDRVVDALEAAGVEGFVRVEHATGNKFQDSPELPRTLTWDASLFIVPAADDEAVNRIASDLERYAGSCEIQPCLRLVATPVERIL